MTKASMSLAELAEKGPDADLLRQMIQFVAQRLMDMDVETLCGAAYGERSAERANSRNGYRERVWETGPGRWTSSCRSCVAAVTFRVFWSPGGRRRRHWRR